MEERGILTGIGVGPGDSELLTLKAIKAIRNSDVIMVPGEDYRQSTAYKIARGAVPELEKKMVVGVNMPMTKEREILDMSYRKAADLAEGWLLEGKNVGFLTLGDVTVYSTYMYVHKLVGADGFQTEIVNGIPSFCAAAARMNMDLVERSEQLHIIPASYWIEDGLELPGTKVLMKAGSQIGNVKEILKKRNLDAVMIENCGMQDEKIYASVDEIDENAGYFSLLIIKDQETRDEQE